MHFEDAANTAGFDLIGPPVHGGSGSVHRARDRTTGDEVALKVLGPGHDLDRLRREADLLGRLNHPNIARLRDLVDLDGQPALVVDWIDGVPLRQLLHDGALGQDRSEAIIEQLAEALGVVHAAGIVHRDVSPANVLVSGDGHVTIIDFGVSRSADTATVTIDGSLAGTPRYLAPEVISGETPTSRSDQYATALVFHELLVGNWPFPDGDSIATALHHQLHTAPTPLGEIDGTIPPSWTDAVLRALDKDPDRRFDTMQDFAAALRATTRVSTLNSGRRLSVASLVFRIGLPVVLVAALLVSLFGGDEDPGADAENLATPTATSAVERGVSTTTVVDRSDEVPTTDEPLETVAPTTTDAAERVLVAGWAAGTAEQLACNLLTEADFETDELPENWFKDGDDLGREQVLVRTGGGVDGSGSLQVGEPGLFGIWGELVPAEQGRRYLFSANARIDGEVFESAMSVDWVDENFGLIASSADLSIVEAGNGPLTLVTDLAPSGTAWAIPRVFKDNGSGLLFLDETVFAPEGSDCEAILRG